MASLFFYCAPAAERIATRSSSSALTAIVDTVIAAPNAANNRACCKDGAPIDDISKVQKDGWTIVTANGRIGVGGPSERLA